MANSIDRCSGGGSGDGGGVKRGGDVSQGGNLEKSTASKKVKPSIVGGAVEGEESPGERRRGGLQQDQLTTTPEHRHPNDGRFQQLLDSTGYFFNSSGKLQMSKPSPAQTSHSSPQMGTQPSLGIPPNFRPAQQPDSKFHTAPAALPPKEPEYPHATAALSPNCDPLDVSLTSSSIDFHAHTYSDPAPNFTAVEIITFLPNAFQAHAIGVRLVNNGMMNPVHLEILRQHRHWHENIHFGFNQSTISNGYLDAMRPVKWRSLPKEEALKLWTRKNHRPPQSRVGENISMAGMGAGVASLPTAPIPFLQLLHGVKKVPQGADAADLTRAIDFAAKAFKAPSEHGGSRVYHFPDDLKAILEFIGPTKVTSEHLDSAVVERYTKSWHRRKNEARQLESAASDPNRTVNSQLSQYGDALTQQRSDAQNAFDANAQPVHDSSQAVPVDAQSQASSSVEHQVSSCIESHAPTPPPDYILLRDLDFPAFFDMTLSGIATRFAQRPSQTDKDWRDCPEHIQQIHDILAIEREQMQQHWGSAPPHAPEPPAGLDLQDLHMLDADYQQSLDLPRMTPGEYENLFGSAAPAHRDAANAHATVAPHALLKADPSTVFLPSALELTDEEMRGYDPMQLLRDCAEADDLNDVGRLARAARFARSEEQRHVGWMVRDVPIIVEYAMVAVAFCEAMNVSGRT